jgi:hypothetical protein
VLPCRLTGEQDISSCFLHVETSLVLALLAPTCVPPLLVPMPRLCFFGRLKLIKFFFIYICNGSSLGAGERGEGRGEQMDIFFPEYDSKIYLSISPSLICYLGSLVSHRQLSVLHYLLLSLLRRCGREDFSHCLEWPAATSSYLFIAHPHPSTFITPSPFACSLFLQARWQHARLVEDIFIH